MTVPEVERMDVESDSTPRNYAKAPALLRLLTPVRRVLRSSLAESTALNDASVSTSSTVLLLQ